MESPEIERFKQLAQKKVGKKIKKVQTVASKVFKTPRKKFEALQGRKLQNVQRHGKYLALEADNGTWIILHFGMTGRLRSIDIENMPKHTALLFVFDDDDTLAYICTRKFGFLQLVDDFDDYLEEHEIGKDAQQITKKQFLDLFKQKRGMIKNALNDQSTIAGIGNMYADEILYQAQIHPKQKIDQLSEDALHKIYKAIQDVLETAINANARISKLPTTYLLKRRKKPGTCHRCNHKIKKIYVSGRPTYFCPKCQKKT